MHFFCTETEYNPSGKKTEVVSFPKAVKKQTRKNACHIYNFAFRVTRWADQIPIRERKLPAEFKEDDFPFHYRMMLLGVSNRMGAGVTGERTRPRLGGRRLPKHPSSRGEASPFPCSGVLGTVLLYVAVDHAVLISNHVVVVVSSPLLLTEYRWGVACGFWGTLAFY